MENVLSTPIILNQIFIFMDKENINAKDSVITKLQNEVTTKNTKLHNLQETLNSCKSQTNADKQIIKELQ